MLQQLKCEKMFSRRLASYCLCTVVLLCVMMASISTGQIVKYRLNSITPSEAQWALDNDTTTFWTLSNGETTAHFEAEFDQPYTVVIQVITPPIVGERSIAMSVSLCLSACVTVLCISPELCPIFTDFVCVLPVAGFSW